jgi:hypothetical protein
MSKHKKPKYTDEPIGEIQILPDFLPSPQDLALKEDTVKITLSLTRNSVEFFKEKALENHSHYQSMIRHLLDEYAEHYRKA